MDKAESKYLNTAARMDQALLELLEKKELAYITVKEICQRAGVSRSTFYLHYETVSDLLAESVAYMNRQFLDYFQAQAEVGPFFERIRTCPLEELCLITPEYLAPYLSYVREHRRLFRTAVEKAAVLARWLEQDCADPIERVIAVIQLCVMGRGSLPGRTGPAEGPQG